MSLIDFDLSNTRIEISFKSFSELRLILSFCKKNKINKINIPCKNNLKKEFLLSSIKISREEFPDIDVLPHFSILHEFKRNKSNTLKSFIYFLQYTQHLGCNEVLLVSGSQKRSTLDSASTLSLLKNNKLISNSRFSIGVAFNPYLPNLLFEDEVKKLEIKVNSGLVTSIWIQFGTDEKLLERRIEVLKRIISSAEHNYPNNKKIILFGSLLIPSKLFLARFNYRPWKGVLCCSEFLESVENANKIVLKLIQTYKKYNIYPVVETNVTSTVNLNSLKNILKI